nr:hydantoinase B/oxoprolinase family protein [Baekduia soli]
MTTVDPVTLAVLQGRLEQIVDEMDATLFRSAFNPTIAEAHDACHGIYDARTGDTLVQGTSGLPIFVGAMAFAVRLAIARAERDGGPADGDVYVFNDPYAGATHLNDVKLVRPLFRDGRLFCWLASVGHFNDVGGNVPGNYNPAARESHQEGVLLPPVKLVDAGVLREDIVDIIRAIGRAPDNAYGDLRAQLSALGLGARRLALLLDDYGDDVVAAAFGQLTDAAERQTRACIAGLADGTYACDDHLDNDGITDVPIRVAVTATVRGDRLALDFTGTDPACAGPLNISRATATAACYVAIKHLFPEVPANAGCLRPVDIAIPGGSLLDAVAPRPVGGYTETILRVMEILFGAIAQAGPERALGWSYGTINALSLAGHRDDGSRWVMFTFFGGGLGGSSSGDGLNHGSAPLSTAVIPPVEVFEATYPVRFTRWALREGSGGTGEHRGGLGATYELEVLGAEAEAFVFGERARHAPRGTLGGGDGAPNVVTWTDADGPHHPALGAKATGIRLHRGDRLRIDSPGGGGYGDPARRAPEAAERDRRLGYVAGDGTGPEAP